jgi:succinoglycan biosynthesis protein ExoO
VSATPLVSVVMANHDGARHLEDAVRSVLGQTLADLELIAVDDASTDDSVARLERAAVRDGRLRILTNGRNGGPAASRNRALAAARGRWIAVVDSDDLMAPDRLARLVARAEADHAEIVVDNQAVFLDADPTTTWPLLDGPGFAAPRWLGLAEVVASSRMYARRPGLGYLKPLISTAALSRAQVRYDEHLRIGEDYDLLIRLLANGLKLRFEPAVLYRYRRHSGSISHVMARGHVEAMLTADAAFEGDFPGLPAPVRRAQAARRRSLERALVYDRVVTALKARRPAAAAVTALPHPDVWPLMAMPIEARLRRLAERVRVSPPPGGARRAVA